MENRKWVFNRLDRRQGTARELSKGLNARIFAGTNSMLSIVHVDPRSSGVVHSHPEEQWGILLEGECIRIQDGKQVHVTEGDFWHTPGNVPHGIRTEASRAVILDIFSPPRGDYARPGNHKPAKGKHEEPASVPRDSGAQEPTAVDDISALTTATLSDADKRTGVLPTRIQAISGGMKLSGRSFTVSCPPRDNLWLHRAIYQASPGDVLVATTGGFREAGYWGELLCRAATIRGLAGLVIDGCVRDCDALEQLGFPVFATGRCARGTTKDSTLPGSMGRPLRIEEHLVRSGDLIVGDADGVVVVSAERIDAAVAAARRIIAREAKVAEGLQEGGRTLDLLGLER